MKIVILNHYERLSPRVFLEASTLKSSGYHVTVIHWYRDLKNFPPSDQERKEFNIKQIHLPASHGSLKVAFMLPRLYNEIWRLLKGEKFDIVHCTQLFLLPIGVYIAKKKKAKIVYDTYERYAIDYANYYFPRFKEMARKVIEMIENFLVRKVNSVLTVSTANKFLAKRYQKFCKNVEVIYNVPSLSLSINRNEIQRLKELYKGRHIITHVGGLSEETGVFKFLEVVDIVKKKFPNILLLVIGVFSYPYIKEQFLECMKKKKLESNIEIINWLPYNKMFQYLKVSHIGLALFQPKEHFKVIGKCSHRKLFTYMQAGIPVISTNFGEIAKVVEEEKCGILVDTTNSKEIANAVIYLLNHPEKAQMMGENGKKAILEKYNWEKESEKLIKIYNSVLEGKHR